MSSQTQSSPSSKSITTTKSPSNAMPPQDRFQFVRETGWARVKPNGVRWSACDIVGEALRLPKHCKHVLKPSPPIHHFGVELQNLTGFVLELEEKSKATFVPTARGRRRQRSDTPILIGIVLSHPMPPSQRQTMEVQEWIRLAIAWLRETYGDAHLVCVLEHVDEEHVHLHAYVHNSGESVKPLMAGHRSAQAAKAAGAPRGELGEAFRTGTRLLQASFYEAVSRPLGMLRKSPSPRPRVSRSAILEQKKLDLDATAIQLAQESKRQATVAHENHQREVSSQDRESALQAKEAELEILAAALNEARAQLERQKSVFIEVVGLLPPDLREDVRQGISTLRSRESKGAARPKAP
jgi:hypothetical protein